MRPDIKKDELASKLRGIIARSGKLKNEVAEKSGISIETLYSYTSGKRSPNVRTLKSICTVCGFDIKEVL